MRVAGFWRRSAAWSLDATLVALATLALCWNTLKTAAPGLADAWTTLADASARSMATAMMATAPDAGSGVAALPGLARESMRDPVLLATAAKLQSALLAFAGPPLAVFAALFFLWCTCFERSPLRATPGKCALGLRVVADDGTAPPTGAILLRFAAGALSWLSLNIGHMLAAIPPDHAALHDRISRTRVVLAVDAAERMPRWAAAWLVLQAAALLLATFGMSLTMGAAMQAAVDRALGG